jgi:hypothetical protein
MRALLLSLLLVSGAAQAALDVSTRATADSLSLDGAAIVAGTGADPLEAFVAQDLANDLKRLGLRSSPKNPVQIWVGTVGRHAQIDALAAAGKLDLGTPEGRRPPRI